MTERPRASDFETPSDLGRLGEFSNDEALSFGLRSALASLPLTWLVILVYVVVFVGWILNPSDLVSTLLLLGLTLGILGVLGWGALRLREETPHHVEIANESLVARWGNTDRKPLTIPFQRIAYVLHAHWKWVGYGKGRYASYVPPGLEYLPFDSDLLDRYAQDDPALRRIVLTRENAQRVRAAVLNWRRAQGLPEEIDATNESA